MHIFTMLSRSRDSKNAASCSSSISAHVDRTLFLPLVNSKKVDLIVHGKMTFLFTTEYVKIRLQLQILC